MTEHDPGAAGRHRAQALELLDDLNQYAFEREPTLTREDVDTIAAAFAACAYGEKLEAFEAELGRLRAVIRQALERERCPADAGMAPAEILDPARYAAYLMVLREALGELK